MDLAAEEIFCSFVTFATVLFWLTDVPLGRGDARVVVDGDYDDCVVDCVKKNTCGGVESSEEVESTEPT